MKHNTLGTKLLTAAVALGVLLYFVLQIAGYFSAPFETARIYEYTVEDSFLTNGVLVREETLLPESGGGLLRLSRSEGERVAAGGEVGMLYTDQEAMDLQDQLSVLETRAEQLRFVQETDQSAEAALRLDTEIREELMDLRTQLTAGHLDRAEDPGEALRELVLKRDYTYEDVEREALSARLRELEQEIRSLRSQSAGSVRRVTAPCAGIYSAVVDGYENVLSSKSIRGLKPSELTAIVPEEVTGTRMGKLITGENWYYAAVMDTEEAELLEESGRASIRFSKGEGRTLDVEVEEVGPKEGDKAVVILRGDTYLSRLTLLRRQSAEVIRRSASGIRVPTEALRARCITINEKGERIETEATGVYCVMGVKAVFKPVRVLYQGDGFVLVESTAEKDREKERLRPGDEVIITAKDLYDGKVVGRAEA